MAPLSFPTQQQQLVVIPCSATKGNWATEAQYLYQSQYFTACLGYAHQVADRILILSALHGLLDLHTRTAPYELQLPRTGPAPDRLLRLMRAQAEQWELWQLQDVLVLGGAAYVRAARTVWPHATAASELLPEGMRGIGHQLQALKTGAAAAAGERAA